MAWCLPLMVERLASLIEHRSRAEMMLFLLNVGLILTGRPRVRQINAAISDESKA